MPAGNSNKLKIAKSARTFRQAAKETCKNKNHKLPAIVSMDCLCVCGEGGTLITSSLLQPLLSICEMIFGHFSSKLFCSNIHIPSVKDRSVYSEDVFMCLCVNEQAKHYLIHDACGEMKAANRHRQ